MTKINATGHRSLQHHAWHDKDTTGITTQPNWKRPPCQAWASHLRPALRRQKRKDQELKTSLVMWWVQGQPGPQRNPASKKQKEKTNGLQIVRTHQRYGDQAQTGGYGQTRSVTWPWGRKTAWQGKSNKHSIWSEEVLWCVFAWLHILHFCIF